MEKEKTISFSPENQVSAKVSMGLWRRTKECMKHPLWICGTPDMMDAERLPKEEVTEVKKGLQEIFTDFGTSLDYPDEALF